MGLLDDRAAIVTGAAQGIGFEIAKLFTAEGASVVLADIDAERANAAAERLDRAVGVACDVTVPGDVDALVAHCVETYGGLDVMVNNAGITRDATMRKMSLEDFDAVLSVHLRGAWLGTRAASLAMREQGSGAIVNMSSISGKVGNIGQTNYSAAKAGIVGLTKASAKELARSGVRVNAVQPGLIRTPMTEGMREDIWRKRLEEIPMERFGEPAEVASVVTFLASEMSSYMTGTVLEVTGGRHM